MHRRRSDRGGPASRMSYAQAPLRTISAIEVETCPSGRRLRCGAGGRWAHSGIATRGTVRERRKVHVLVEWLRACIVADRPHDVSSRTEPVTQGLDLRRRQAGQCVVSPAHSDCRFSEEFFEGIPDTGYEWPRQTPCKSTC